MKTYTEEQMKLAFKGTPGPWYITFKEEMISIHNGLTDEQEQLPDGNYTDPNICGIWAAEVDDDRRLYSEANAYIISAAPEAIEFIADLLNGIDNDNDNDGMWPDKCSISRAEEIIKKAYNL